MKIENKILTYDCLRQHREFVLFSFFQKNKSQQKNCSSSYECKKKGKRSLEHPSTIDNAYEIEM